MLTWNLKVGKYCSTTENVKINNHKVFKSWKIEKNTIFLKMEEMKIQRTMEIEKKVNPRHCSDMGEMGEIEQ